MPSSCAKVHNIIGRWLWFKTLGSFFKGMIYSIFLLYNVFKLVLGLLAGHRGFKPQPYNDFKAYIYISYRSQYLCMYDFIVIQCHAYTLCCGQVLTALVESRERCVVCLQCAATKLRGYSSNSTLARSKKVFALHSSFALPSISWLCGCICVCGCKLV